MQEIAIIVVAIVCMVPIIVRMSFRHLKERAMINQQAHSNPRLEADVQELKQQVADIRELMIDMALEPSNTKIAQRVNQDILN